MVENVCGLSIDLISDSKSFLFDKYMVFLNFYSQIIRLWQILQADAAVKSQRSREHTFTWKIKELKFVVSQHLLKSNMIDSQATGMHVKKTKKKNINNHKTNENIYIKKIHIAKKIKKCGEMQQ